MTPEMKKTIEDAASDLTRVAECYGLSDWSSGDFHDEAVAILEHVVSVNTKGIPTWDPTKSETT